MIYRNIILELVSTLIYILMYEESSQILNPFEKYKYTKGLHDHL